MMTIAMPTGKLYKPAVEVLKRAGMSAKGLENPGRRLIFEGDAEFILVKPADVPAYVELGAADIGIAGSDVIAESARAVCELADLGIGKCRLVMAACEPDNRRVGTKYPRMAETYFIERGMQMEYVKLNGSVELACVLGLTHCIVDIVETGTTLKENGLVEVATIAQCSARLIGNRVACKYLYRQEINELLDRLK